MATFGSTVEGNRFHDSFTSHVYNVNTSHPLIPNQQEYMFYNKYVSIHSEDRDIIKYPNSSEFEIELPEDMLNVSAIRLVQWTFPANYNTFSITNNNVLFAFKIPNPYNPGEFGVSNDLAFKIFEALFTSVNHIYTFIIEEGFYNPLQMATEMTNKMNSVVTQKILNYFTEKGWTDSITLLNDIGGYTRFIVVYNNVSQKLWFGNNVDGFILVNEVGILTNEISETLCIREKTSLPDASNWGLAGYLGLTRCNTKSISSFDLNTLAEASKINGVAVPRFYYGDVTPGDNGYWLLPNTDLSGSVVHWVEPPFKINLMGEAFLYMDLTGHNCIDETKPYNLSAFTLETNQTNGVVDSAFAKIGVPTTPISQWFDRDSIPYKYYYPPAERIRRLKIRIRYHNGKVATFGVFNYSFMLQFTLMVPQILRESRSVVYPPPTGR